MVQVVHGLRGLLRSSIGACVITFPAHLHSPETVKKIENLSDYIVRLESFDGNIFSFFFRYLLLGIGAKVPDAFSEFDGLFFVNKLPVLNCLVPHIPETNKYVFQLGRRKFHLEIPHMGPEESRTTSKPHEGALACMPGPPGNKNNLDF
jgi:hypothetical protein